MTELTLLVFLILFLGLQMVMKYYRFEIVPEHHHQKNRSVDPYSITCIPHILNFSAKAQNAALILSCRQKQARNPRNSTVGPNESPEEFSKWIQAWRTFPIVSVVPEERKTFKVTFVVSNQCSRNGIVSVNIRHSPYWKQRNFWGCLIVPKFSSHPACLSTRLVVFAVYLRDWAETTAARLITFPLTAWSHSRPVVFSCMDSDRYSTCCMWIGLSLASNWKVLLQQRWHLCSISVIL